MTIPKHAQEAIEWLNGYINSVICDPSDDINANPEMSRIKTLIDTIHQQAAEITRLECAIVVQRNAVKTLDAARAKIDNSYQSMYEAEKRKEKDFSAIDSQREANAILTEENERLQKRIAELEKVEMWTEWQPIETAPKDGRRFLATDGYGHEIIRWHNGVWIVRRCSDPFYDEEWDENTPTAWMALPSKHTHNENGE